MAIILIEREQLRLGIAPAIGGGVAELSLRGPDGRWWPLWRPAPPQTGFFNDLACYLLAPWSNRIAGARFRFNGRDIQLRPDWPDGTAIHGVVKDRPWTILDRSPISARLGFDSRETPDLNWLWAFAATARYELRDGAVEIELAVTNLADSPMPAGLGFHPYFMRRLWDDRDDVQVRASLAGRYPAKNMIPTGPAMPDEVTAHLAAGRPLAPLVLDDVFEGFDPRTQITWPASGVRARLGASPTVGHTVIYSPAPAASGGPGFFCLEPVTMVNDGFNARAVHASVELSDERPPRPSGVKVLGPGQTLTAGLTLRIER